MLGRLAAGWLGRGVAWGSPGCRCAFECPGCGWGALGVRGAALVGFSGPSVGARVCLGSGGAVVPLWGCLVGAWVVPCLPLWVPRGWGPGRSPGGGLVGVPAFALAVLHLIRFGPWAGCGGVALRPPGCAPTPSQPSQANSYGIFYRDGRAKAPCLLTGPKRPAI